MSITPGGRITRSGAGNRPSRPCAAITSRKCTGPTSPSTSRSVRTVRCGRGRHLDRPPASATGHNGTAAIDYCPPIDVRFGSYLRAVVTADSDAVPDDPFGYRDAFVKAFRRRNITIRNVRDLSEDSLRWKAPDLEDVQIPKLAFSRLRFSDNGLHQPSEDEIKRRAAALGDFLADDPARLRLFGLNPPGDAYQPIVIQSIRLAHRIGPDSIPRNDLIAEVTQERRTPRNIFIGGATVVVGTGGEVRYVIRRRVDDLRRRRDESRYAGEGGARRLDFRAVHKGTARS